MQRIDHISLFTSFLYILGIETSFETDWFPVCNQEDGGEKDTQNRDELISTLNMRQNGRLLLTDVGIVQHLHCYFGLFVHWPLDV